MIYINNYNEIPLWAWGCESENSYDFNHEISMDDIENLYDYYDDVIYYLIKDRRKK
jgi:hypothetical protein